MRAVCTRLGRRGTAMGVCAHEEGLCRSRGGSRVPLLFFSPRDGGKNTSSREEALLFRREDPFSTLRQSFFCLVSFFFSFFQTDHPLFWTARHPTGKGWKPRGGEGEKPQLLLHSRDSQPDSLLFLVIILRAFCSFVCCCSRAITLAVRQINWNLELLRFVGCVFDLNFSLEMFLCFRRF